MTVCQRRDAPEAQGDGKPESLASIFDEESSRTPGPERADSPDRNRSLIMGDFGVVSLFGVLLGIASETLRCGHKSSPRNDGSVPCSFNGKKAELNGRRMFSANRKCAVQLQQLECHPKYR